MVAGFGKRQTHNINFFPGSSSLTAHPSFWSGPKIRNHRTCWTWMDARLPFQNMHQNPLLGQTRYYAPEEKSCLFRWVDPFTTITYSLSPVERSPRHYSPLSLYSYFISSMVLCFKYVFISQFHLLLPTVLRSLPRTPHVSTLQPFTLATTAHFLPFAFHSSTHTTATFPIHTITVFTTLFIHSLSQTHAPSHFLPLPPLPHQPLIPHINRTGIPIPVINNEFLSIYLIY